MCMSVLCRPGDDLLSHVLRQSTIGAKAFDGRVRDGIGSGRLARATRPAKDGVLRSKGGSAGAGEQGLSCRRRLGGSPDWSFRVGMFSRSFSWRSRSRHVALATRAIKPNERLVPVSFTRCRASTSGLSTWWSSTALQGELVLRLVSRLDAFSGYPFHI